ncbi:MAG: hypothetical protein H8E14_16280 [Candidatus Marinimicrobia bacterium]|nr:hypothetical protein [Candidatus Neomarinimicrobiota bacterium]
MKFVKYLPQFGWEPIILTVRNGDYSAIDQSLRSDIPNGIKIFSTDYFSPFVVYKPLVGLKKDTRLPTALLTKNSVGFRNKLASWIRRNLFIPDARIGWLPQGVQTGNKLIKRFKPAVIFSTSPPPTVHLIGLILSKLHRLQWVADFRDPWTNIYHYAASPRLGVVNWIDAQLEKKVLAAADRVTVVGNNFFDCEPVIKTVVIPNGYDLDDVKRQSRRAVNLKFIIRYMGSFKSRQYVPVFFTLLEELSQNADYKRNISVEFIGQVDPDIIRKIKARKIPVEIKFHGYLDHNRAVELITNANMLLFIIGRSAKANLIVTGKLFEYLMTGNPILAYGPRAGAANTILEKTGSGRMFDYDNIRSARDYLIKYYELWKQGEYYSCGNFDQNTKFDRRILTRKLVNVFEELR